MSDFDDMAVVQKTARGDIAERYAFHIGTRISPQGNEAIVVFALNTRDSGQLTFSHLIHMDTGWQTAMSYKTEMGLGASSADGDRFVIYLIERAPPDAKEAVVEITRERRTFAIENGYLFAAAWGQESPSWSDVEPPLSLVEFA